MSITFENVTFLYIDSFEKMSLSKKGKNPFKKLTVVFQKISHIKILRKDYNPPSTR